MATLNKNEFYELRNSIYGGLAKQGIITESDVTFIEIENIIINSEGIRIDWEDESEINSRDEAITHRFKCILEDLEKIKHYCDLEIEHLTVVSYDKKKKK